MIHSVMTTATSVHDLTPAAELLRGDTEVAYGDAGYSGMGKLPEMVVKSMEFQLEMRSGIRRVLPNTPDGCDCWIWARRRMPTLGPRLIILSE